MNSLESETHVSRRTFLKGSAVGVLALGGAALPAARGQFSESPSAPNSPPRQTKVIDCHAHLYHRSRRTWETDNRKLIEAADKLGIDEL